MPPIVSLTNALRIFVYMNCLYGSMEKYNALSVQILMEIKIMKTNSSTAMSQIMYIIILTPYDYRLVRRSNHLLSLYVNSCTV